MYRYDKATELQRPGTCSQVRGAKLNRGAFQTCFAAHYGSGRDALAKIVQTLKRYAHQYIRAVEPVAAIREARQGFHSESTSCDAFRDSAVSNACRRNAEAIHIRETCNLATPDNLLDHVAMLVRSNWWMRADFS